MGRTKYLLGASILGRTKHLLGLGSWGAPITCWGLGSWGAPCKHLLGSWSVPSTCWDPGAHQASTCWGGWDPGAYYLAEAGVLGSWSRNWLAEGWGTNNFALICVRRWLRGGGGWCGVARDVIDAVITPLYKIDAVR